MYIDNIEINNFRNINKIKIQLINSANIFIGDNAQGKTNIAEAIYYSCMGYSTRSKHIKDLIQFDQNIATIKAYIQFKNTNNNIQIILNKTNNKKEIFFNDIKINKIVNFVGNIKCVFFSPKDIQIVNGAQENKRKFLDMCISNISKQYLLSLQKYNLILKQRNTLLKTNDINNINNTLSIWDKQLIEVGTNIILLRQKYIDQLNKYICFNKNVDIANINDINIIYNPSIADKNICQINEYNIKKTYYNLLQSTIMRDKYIGYTTYGPHKDNINIYTNNIDSSIYASQGQQKSISLALKIAEYCILKNTYYEEPILILDDIFSELHTSNINKILNLIKNTQSIITMTDFNKEMFSSINYKLFTVSNGKIID